MSFWGMSNTGKDASGKMGEIPQWLWQLAKDSWGRGNDEYARGQGLENDYLAYLQEAQDAGIGGIDGIRGMGEQIMPGVDEAIGNRQGRTQRLRELAQGMQSAGMTTDQISQVLDQQGGSINTDYDTIDSDTRDTFQRQTGRADAFGRDRVNNIKDVYGGANTVLDQVHGGNVDRTKSTYGGLLGELDPAFAEMQKRVEQFKPGSEARGARVGRSFNPAMASMANRLRRGGVDLTSPEAAASLARIDTARATAMDDSLASDTDRYVQQSNSLALNKLGQKQGLSLSQLGDLVGMDTAYGDKKVNLGLSQGKDFRGEMTQQEETGRNLDLARLGMNADNTNNAGARRDAWFKQKANLPLLSRDMEQEDFALQSGLDDRANTDDLTGFGLKNEQFDRGMNYNLGNLDRKDRAAGARGGIGNNAFNRAMGYTQLGGQQGAGAMGGFQNTFDREGVNAGWGLKGILGLGGAALNLVAPGAGSLVTGFGGGSGGGGGDMSSGLSSLWSKLSGKKGVQSPAFVKSNPTSGMRLGTNPFGPSKLAGGGNW